MTNERDMDAQSVDELEVLVGQGDMDAKRELARRLIEGNGVPQNHQKAVALLKTVWPLVTLMPCSCLPNVVHLDLEWNTMQDVLNH